MPVSNVYLTGKTHTVVSERVEFCFSVKAFLRKLLQKLPTYWAVYVSKRASSPAIGSFSTA